MGKRLIAPETWEPDWEATLALAEAAESALDLLDGIRESTPADIIDGVKAQLRTALLSAGYEEEK